ALDILGKAGTQPAMVAESIESCRRDGVHGVCANQLFDVEHVAELGILRARAGPQQPLRLRTLRCQSLPACSAKKLLVFLVGVPGILIITFGRFTPFHRRCASAMVALVSYPRKGETSRLT